MEKLKIPRFHHICFTWINKGLRLLNPPVTACSASASIPVLGQSVCEVSIRCVQVNGVHKDARFAVG